MRHAVHASPCIVLFFILTFGPALAEAGLRIEYVHEFPFAAWAALKSRTKGDDGYYRFPPGVAEVPMMMSLKATKRA